MRGTRVIGVAGVLLLCALIVGAVVLETTTGSASPPTPAHLDVAPGPLTTATGYVTYSDAGGTAITATCAFDFTTGAADVVATDSISIASVTLEARIVAPVLYLNATPLSSVLGAPWLATVLPHAAHALAGLERFLRHPDLARLARRRTSTRTTGSITTSTYALGTIRLPSTEGLPLTLPSGGALTLTVTTGAQGQLLEVAAALRSPGGTVRATYEATGYDVNVSILAPPHHEVVALTPARAKELLGVNYPATEHLLQRFGASTRTAP